MRYCAFIFGLLLLLVISACAQQSLPIDVQMAAYQSKSAGIVGQMASSLNRNLLAYQNESGARGLISVSLSTNYSAQTQYANATDAAKACLQEILSLQASVSNWATMGNGLAGCLSRILGGTGGINSVAFNAMTGQAQGNYMYVLGGAQQPLQNFNPNGAPNLAHLVQGSGWETQ